MTIQPLFAVLIALVAAYVIGELLKKVGIPRVVGQILAGLLLGMGFIKSQLFTADSLSALSFLAHLGIVLLFYYVGLEINFRTFRKNLRISLWISIWNTVLPFLLGFVVMKFILHFETITSIIVGLSLSVSAQTICVELLEELKLLRSRFGALMVSVGTVDDLLELLVVTLLLSIFHLAGDLFSVWSLLRDIIFFIGVIVIAKRWFIPFTLKFFEKENSSTARFTASMVIVLLIASLSELLGLSLLIGALFAGMIVRQTIFRQEALPDREEQDIARSVHIIAFGFLIPLFFVWVGLNADLVLAWKKIPLIALLLLLGFLGTIGGTLLAMKLAKRNLHEGLLLGWGLTPKGDVELVVAAVAYQVGAIDQTLFTALVLMSLLTTLVSPVVFKYLVKMQKGNIGNTRQNKR